jgi:hypothetical protein
MRKFAQWMRETKLNEEQPQVGQPGGVLHATGTQSRLSAIDDPKMRAMMKKQQALGHPDEAQPTASGQLSQNATRILQTLEGMGYSSKAQLRKDLNMIFQRIKFLPLPEGEGDMPDQGVTPGGPPDQSASSPLGNAK